MDWKSIEIDGIPIAPNVLFAQKTGTGLDDSGWSYYQGIKNKVINQYVNHGRPIILGKENHGCTHYLIPEPPTEGEPASCEYKLPPGVKMDMTMIPGQLPMVTFTCEDEDEVNHGT